MAKPNHIPNLNPSKTMHKLQIYLTLYPCSYIICNRASKRLFSTVFLFKFFLKVVLGSNVVIIRVLIHVTMSLFLKCLFYSFIPDQCVESSLQVKISSPTRTVYIKQEPEEHLDLSKFRALCLSKQLFLFLLLERFLN